MFNTRVFTFSVLTDKHGVDVVIGSLITLDGQARSHVREKVESTTKGKVERDVTLSD